MIFDRKLVRRIAGAVPAQMFACGAAFIVADVLGLGVARQEIFLASLITILALNVVFYNRWTALAGAALAAVGIAAAFMSGWASEFAAEAPALAEELIELVRVNAGGGEIRLLAARLIATAFALAAFLTAGRFCGSVVLAVSTLVIFIAAWYAGEREVFGCMALCASATAAVSAVNFAAKRAKAAGEAVEKNTGVATIGSPGGIALLAVPIVLAIAVICTFFRPLELSRNLRVHVVEDALDDAIDSIASNFKGFSRRSTVFSLNAVGYGSVAKLGGPVELTDDPMLYVSVSRDGYLTRLRGSVRSVYTGIGWQDGEPGGSHRFASRLWEQERIDAFDLMRGGMDRANSHFLTAHERLAYTVEHRSHLTSMFTIERPETVENRLYTPYFNLQGELFPKTAMEPGTAYTVTGYAQRAMTRSAARSLTRMVENADDEEPGEFLENLYAEYLPDGAVELRVAEGERSIAREGENEYPQSVVWYDDFGWVRSPQSMFASAHTLLGAYTLPDGSEGILEEAKSWLRGRATDYYLFYGYTEEDMALIAENERRIAEQRAWLEANRSADVVDTLTEEFRAELVWPEAQPMWLTEAQMAVYGVDLRDPFWSLVLYSEEASERSYVRVMELVGEEYRRAMREWAFVSTGEQSIGYRRSEDGGYDIVGGSHTPSPGEQEGYYAGSVVLRQGSRESERGLALIAEENGFARLEYAGMVEYLPDVGEELATVVGLSYLAGLEDGDEPNGFELMLALAQEIDDVSTYTLEPAPVPEGVDFVDWFISTGEGYCTYYASAMAVLARELGVPSRYVEGYSLENALRTENGAYELTGENAHAWAEVFFEGVGWIAIDPLGLDMLDIEDEDEPEDEERPVVEAPSMAPSAEPIEVEPDDGEDDTDGGVPFWVWIIAAAVAVVGVVGGFVAVRAAVVSTRRLRRLRKKYGERGAVRELWGEITRGLAILEPLCVRGGGETASEFAERARKLIFIEDAPIVDVTRAAEKAWYSGEEPSEGELELMDRCARAVRRMMLRRSPLSMGWMFRKNRGDGA